MSFTALFLAATASLAPAAPQNDTAAVAAAVRAFHAALVSGDSTAALALLAPDVIILEAGGVESRAEYRAHHLAADIRFAQAVPGTSSPIAVTVEGDVAWASSTSVTVGTMDGRAVNSVGAELMVLTRSPEGWRIRAIHWSSRRRPAS